MKVTKKIIIVSIAVALLPGMAIAQPANSPGYVVSTSGQVVKGSFNDCWHTGFWTPAMAIADCDAVPIAQAEVPKPERAEAAAPAPTPEPTRVAQKVSFSADALFSFDSALLKPEGKMELDDFARNLKGMSYGSIHVTGHTDRFGSDKYNQKLSEQRANSVKDYLVGKDIAIDQISAEGVGKTQPTTQPGDCPGSKSQKVIACLQPDRRVDVEVNGSK